MQDEKYSPDGAHSYSAPTAFLETISNPVPVCTVSLETVRSESQSGQSPPIVRSESLDARSSKSWTEVVEMLRQAIVQLSMHLKKSTPFNKMMHMICFRFLQDRDIWDVIEEYEKSKYSPIPITHIGIVYKGSKFEYVPPGFFLVENSVGNRQADLNRGGRRNTYIFFGRGENLPPITALSIISASAGEEPPLAYEAVYKTTGGRPANLHGENTQQSFLCYSRGDGPPVTDIIVGHEGKKEKIPEDYHIIQRTLLGAVPYIDSNKTVIAYRRDYTGVLNTFKPGKDEKLSKKEMLLRKCLTCIIAGFYSFDIDIFKDSLMAFTIIDIPISPDILTRVICILTDAVYGYLSYFGPCYFMSVTKFVQHTFKERYDSLTPEGFCALLQMLMFLRPQDSKDNVSRNVLLKKVLKKVKDSLRGDRTRMLIKRAPWNRGKLQIDRKRNNSRDLPKSCDIAKEIVLEMVQLTVTNKVIDVEARDFFRTKFADFKLRKRASSMCSALFLHNKYEAMLATTVVFLSKVSSEELPERLSKGSEIVKRRIYAIKLLQHILESARGFFKTRVEARIILRRFFAPSFLESCVTSVPGLFRNVLSLYISMFKQYRDILKLELGVLLKSGFVGILNCKYCTPDQKIDILDMISNVITSGQDLVDLFYNYDSSSMREIDIDVCARLISVVQNIADPRNVGKFKDGEQLRKEDDAMKKATTLLRRFMEYLATWAKVPNLKAGGNLEELSQYSNQFSSRGDELGESDSVQVILKTGTDPFCGEDTLEQNSETDDQRDKSSSPMIHTPSMANTPSVSAPFFRDDRKSGSETPAFKVPSSHSGLNLNETIFKHRRASSWANRFTTKQEDKAIIEQALDLCREQKLKTGLKFLHRHGGPRGSIMGLAKFLHENDTLDKTEIGEFISMDEAKFLTSEELKQLRQEYCALLDFTGMDFDKAFRMFLTDCGFRMPKESQKVERLLQAFSKAFVLDNPSSFKNNDACLVIAYAVLMLNTELHDPRAKKANFIPMTRAKFHDNLVYAGEDTKDISQRYTDKLYSSILENPVEWIEEDDADYLQQSETVIWQRFRDDCKALARRVHAELRRVAYCHQQWHTSLSKVIVHGLFKISWANFLSCISSHLNDEFCVEVCVYQMMKYGATTSLMLGFYEEMEAFLRLLARCLYVSEHPTLPPEVLSQKMVEGAHLDIPFYDRIKRLQRTNPAMVCQIIARLANDLRAKSIYDSRQQNLRTLESQFGNELYLAHPEREYTLKGKLKKVNRSGKSTDYTFFLFNDVIIYAQRTGNDKFKVHRTLQLGLVEVRDGQLKRYEHVFILVSPQKTLHLVAESEKEKQTWMEHIRKNIWKLDEDRMSWSKNSSNQQLQVPRSREHSLFIGRKPEFKTFELKRAEELEQTKGRRSNARYRSSSRRGGSWEMESLVRDSNISTISNRYSAINFTDLKTLKREQPCKLCLKPFSLFRRCYSCPWCQDMVCMNCVMKERIVLPFENKPGIPQREQRVCEACGYYIQHEEELNKLGGVI